MAYKYFNIVTPVSTASQVLTNNFNALINTKISEAADYYSFTREYPFASGSYTGVNGRITTAINTLTGEKLSDDFKCLIFAPNQNFTANLGDVYYFDNNYWLCTYSDSLKSLVNSCVVRRCNNRLRWIDDDGNYYAEPCIIDYTLDRSKDTIMRESIIVPQGYIAVYAQSNARTRTIRPNQRFLFGNADQRISWKIFGNAIQNSILQETLDDDSSKLLTLTFGGYEVAESTDNLTLGIADYYIKQFSITLSASSISGNIGEEYQLYGSVINNGNILDKPITFVSSSSPIVSTTASGLISLDSSGSAIITCYMVNNPSVSASALITSSSVVVSNYEIRVTPSNSISILEGDSQIFVTDLFVDGIDQSASFVYTTASVISTEYYTLTSSGSNTVVIDNLKRYLYDDLTITATSGSYSTDITIKLEGAW